MTALPELRIKLAAAAILIAALATASAKEPDIPRIFHGQWQGTMQLAKLREAPKDFQWYPVRVRIDITAAKTRVFFLINEKWDEVESFGMTAFDTNAVITSIRTGTTGDERWVETWSFALTVVGAKKRMHASAHRQVNNKTLHYDHPNVAFGGIAFGVLELVPDDNG